MARRSIPIGFRVRHQTGPGTAAGTADRDYAKLLHQDLKLRDYLMSRLQPGRVGKGRDRAGAAKKTRVTIHSARPGRRDRQEGADIEKLRQELSNRTGSDVSLNILEIRSPRSMPSWWPRTSPASWSAVSRFAGR